MRTLHLGNLDVDAGMVMLGDPCYWLPDDAPGRTDDIRSWSRFCAMVGDARTAEPGRTGAGLVVQVPGGDGTYPVLAEIDHRGSIRRVIIDFTDHDVWGEELQLDLDDQAW
jgi:hypothetical protein